MRKVGKRDRDREMVNEREQELQAARWFVDAPPSLCEL